MGGISIPIRVTNMTDKKLTIGVHVDMDSELLLYGANEGSITTDDFRIRKIDISIEYPTPEELKKYGKE